MTTYDEMIKKLAERNAAAAKTYQTQTPAQVPVPVTNPVVQKPIVNPVATTQSQTVPERLRRDSKNTAPQIPQTPAPTQPVTNSGNTIEFTPGQIDRMLKTYGSKQALYSDVIARAKAKGMDGGKILNSLNVAFKGVEGLPSKVVTPAIGSTEKDLGMNLPATDKYFEDMIAGAKDPEAAANMAGIRNDFSSFFQRNEEIANQIDKWFPGLDNLINQSGDLTNKVGNEILDKLEVEREMFLERNQDLRKRVYETYKNSANIINNIYTQENSRIASNAAAAGMSGGPAMAAKSRANAMVFEEQEKLAKEELEQYKALDSTVDEYMKRYMTTYGQSRDKYVIDNFNNMLTLKSSLLTNISNIEIQNRDLAARAAESASLANAIGGQATGGTPTSNLAGGGEQAPTIPGVTRSPNGALIDTPLRKNVEPRNPNLFKNLPVSTQEQLIKTYGSVDSANKALSTASISTNAGTNQSPTKSIAEQVIASMVGNNTGSITAAKDPTTVKGTQEANVLGIIKGAEDNIKRLGLQIESLEKQLKGYSNQQGSTQYRYILSQLNSAKSQRDSYNNTWTQYRTIAKTLGIQL